MRANERTDERVAQYLCLYSCSFQSTVERAEEETAIPDDNDNNERKPWLSGRSLINFINIDEEKLPNRDLGMKGWEKRMGGRDSQLFFLLVKTTFVFI